MTWNIGSLAAGASVTRLVEVQVNTPVPAGVTSITNTATATDDGTNGPDPTPADNTGTDTDTLVAAPDLVLLKDDGVVSVVAGQTLTYTLTLPQRRQPGGHRRDADRHAAGQHHASSAPPTAARSPPAS